MRKTREEKKEITRKAIINAAIKLFGEKGFEDTSIEELAREAGIGKGTIYTYFQTKFEIFHAFCEDQLEFIHEQLARKNDVNAPIIDQMMTIFMGEFEYVTKNKEFGRIFMQHIVFPTENQILHRETIDDKWLSLLFSVCKHAQDRNELRQDLDLLYIVGHFYGLYIMAVSAWYSGRISTAEVEPGMKKLFKQALEGLCPKVQETNQLNGNGNEETA